MTKLKCALCTLLGLLMIFAGVSHFLQPETFLKIIPPIFPAPLALVYISGVFEILGGAGLFIRPLRRYAAWGLVALFVAVFPANIYMAVNEIPFGEGPTPTWALWLRLPLQFVLIAWAYWLTKPICNDLPKGIS